jgi:hypothetical protein
MTSIMVVLPAPLGPNHATQLTVIHRKREFVEGFKAIKTDGHGLEIENRRALSLLLRMRRAAKCSEIRSHRSADQRHGYKQGTQEK